MKDIFEYIGPLWKLAGYPLLALLCTALAAAGPTLWKLAVQIWTLRKQRILKRDLFPFYTRLEARTATRYYVKTKCQNVAPSKDEEPRLDNAKAVKQNALRFFLKTAFNPNKEDCQFYIVLADSGMGKTTFLLNLYLRYINQFATPQYDIKIFPLAYSNVDAKIAAIEEKGQTILLLDAFDEDMQAVQDYKARLGSLITLTKDFREVVITCRTQFFPSEYEEPRETGVMRYGGDGGEQEFYKFYISPFDDDDIQSYLRKRFPWYQRDKRQKAQVIVEHSPNLMVRPMLLQHIEDLLQDDKTYNSSYAVYAELINRWVKREARKVGSERRERYLEELYQFTREIALDLYKRRQERQGALLMSGADIQTFADKHGIKLSTMEMKSKSLLNRNAQGQYKFSHKSILEYLLAEEAFFNKDFRSELDFDGMNQAKVFFDEMIWEKLTVPFFSQGNVEGTYTLKDGKSGILMKHPEKILPDITTLNLEKWDLSNNLLLFSGLPSLRLVGVNDKIRWAVLRCKHTTSIFKFDMKGRPLTYIANEYEDRGEVVFDQTIELLWQKSCSAPLNYQEALKYVQQLNREKFADYEDWRLPTIPELISLLESEKQSNRLYINPVFDNAQGWCWSADKRTKGTGLWESAWKVNFRDGSVDCRSLQDRYSVRCVRSEPTTNEKNKRITQQMKE